MKMTKTCIHCNGNSLTKSGFAINGIQLWQCRSCGRRFRAVRYYGRGQHRPCTLKRREQLMIKLPMDAIAKDYTMLGLPMVKIASKFDCSAETIKNRLIEYGTQLRSRSEQTQISYTKVLRSKAKLGNTATLGYKHTPESKRKMSAHGRARFTDLVECKKISDQARIRWQGIDYRNDQLVRMLAGRQVFPNKPESRIISIIAEYQLLGWEYVGDWSAFIGGRNPDFINRQHNKILEFFGDFWHREQDETNRCKTFRCYGYDTMVIWEHELNKLKDADVAKLISVFTEEAVAVE